MYIHEVMIYNNCKRFSVIFQHIKFYIVPVHNVLDFIFLKSLCFSSEHSQTQKTVQDSRQPLHMNLRHSGTSLRDRRKS